MKSKILGIFKFKSKLTAITWTVIKVFMQDKSSSNSRMLKRRRGVLGHFDRAVHLKKKDGIALGKNSGLKGDNHFHNLLFVRSISDKKLKLVF